MDLVTQGLLGSAVAQAGFSKTLGKKTALYGFIAGLLPDFDIVSGFWGEWASLKYHRGPTHSLPVLILLSIPIGYLFKKITKSEASLNQWSLMSFACLFTHPLIDWCTTYGTPLFWPFSSTRFANDGLPIIDPLYSLPLLIVSFIGIFNLLTPGKRKALAIAALMISTAYAFQGYNNSQGLVKEAQKLFAEQGFDAVSIRATPTLFNNRLFRVIGKSKEKDFLLTYMKAGNPQPVSPIEKIVSDKSELAEKALNHPNGKLFDWFAMGMICPKLRKNPDGSSTIILDDMRYGFITDLQNSLFSAEASFDKNGNLTSLSRNHGNRRMNLKHELNRMAEEFFQ